MNLRGRRGPKPPVALEVSDLLNFARLAMGRVDVQPLLWNFSTNRSKRGRNVLGYLSTIPYWRGNLPVFAFVSIDRSIDPKDKPLAYLAYTNLAGEKAFFTNSTGDPKYQYAAVVETEEEPELFALSLNGKKTRPEMPVSIKAKNVNSLLRMLVMMSDNVASPPLWLYERGAKHVLGLVAPFFDYYEANALPVFFYIEGPGAPPAPFIRYLSAQDREEISYASFVTEMKYFYARIVKVNNMPFHSLMPRNKRST